MVTLTSIMVLRRSAALLRKGQTVARSSSFLKPCVKVRQKVQQESLRNATGGNVGQSTEAGSAAALARSPESVDREGITAVHGLDSNKIKRVRIEDLQNRISHIIASGQAIDALHKEIVRHLPNIEVVYLFDNQLIGVDSIGLWSRLRKAYLQNNLICSMRGLENLCNLEELNLDHNRIERLEGLLDCARLTRLSLANQQISQPLTFDAATLRTLSKSLCFLNVSHNGVEDLRPIAALRALESFEAVGNAVHELGVIGAILRGCRGLKAFDLRDNPVSRTPKLRQYLRCILFQASDELCEVDGKRVIDLQRTFVHEMHRYLRNSHPGLQQGEVARGKVAAAQ